ncbi:hypothetical protein TPHA_0K00690 [Tetrapisispora phaffii CBS 4417]|uniref:Serine/threonine-protein kinase Tel1 n=1 Tax=Tetrapisispora phaffii (strain ATCC 24235 / CBS 4417 / NBRC 1672 / NRRL Y-8282 / UCD 70-5) TaxID=1071381 RepID=G8BZ75_TETPH|nr:hypothetical protein TPHA_0K00690 [Tetrapisispora phaffii CBS 4417]CCE65203.1 hypothetical protein TPHA_0K00690 [Tetrapisispora phaffii CBS 4417]
MENSYVTGILQALASTKLKERHNAIDELRTLLKDSPQQLPTKYLNNTAVTLLEILDYEHRKYSELLKNESNERTGSKRNLVENRLTDISYLLRLFIEKLSNYFKVKTLKVLVNALPELMVQNDSDKLMEPISVDLSFSLLSIIESGIFKLNYTEEQWINLVSIMTDYLFRYMKVKVNNRNISNFVQIICSLLSLDTVGMNLLPKIPKLRTVLLELLDSNEKENAITKNLFEISAHLITITQFTDVQNNLTLIEAIWKYYLKIEGLNNDETKNRLELINILAADIINTNKHLFDSNQKTIVSESFLSTFTEYIKTRATYFILPNLSTKLMSFDYQLRDLKKSWLAFPNFQFNPESDDVNEWIRLYSLTMLLKSYFNTTKFTEDENVLFKKRRTDTSISSILSNSSTMVEFLINCMNSEYLNVQLEAIVFLPFYTESTNTSIEDANNLMEEVLARLNTSNAISWISLCLISLLSTLSNNVSKTTLDLIIGFTIPLISKKQDYKIACILLSRCILFYPESKINERVLDQLYDIYELPELKGPFLPCNESYLFWRSLQILGYRYKSQIGETSTDKMSIWLKSKIKDNFEIENRNDEMPQFLKWLSGKPYERKLNYYNTYDSFGPKRKLWNTIYRVWQLTAEPRQLSVSLDSHDSTKQQHLDSFSNILVDNRGNDVEHIFYYLMGMNESASITKRFTWLCFIGKSLDYNPTHLISSDKVSFFVNSLSTLFGSINFIDEIDLTISLEYFLDLIDCLNDKCLLQMFPFQKLLIKYFETRSSLKPRIKVSSAVNEFQSHNIFTSEFNKHSIEGTMTINELKSILKVIELYFTNDIRIDGNITNIDFLLEFMITTEKQYMIFLLPNIYKILRKLTDLSGSQLRMLSDAIANILLNGEFRNSSFGLKLLADYLNNILDLCLQSDNPHFCSDYNDMFNWITAKIADDTFSDAMTYVTMSKYMLNLLQFHDFSAGQLKFKKQDIFSVLSKCMSKLGPVLLLIILPGIKDYMSSISVKNQKIIFDEIITLYKNNNVISKDSLLYYFVLSELVTVSHKILMDSIIELEKLHVEMLNIGQIELTIKRMVRNLKWKNELELFNNCKYDLITHWIDNTPRGSAITTNIWKFCFYQIPTKNEFVKTYYVELISLLYSKDVINTYLITDIEHELGCMSQDILPDWLPYAITFSYLNNGAGDNIMNKLNQYFGSQVTKTAEVKKLHIIKLLLYFSDLGSLVEIEFLFRNMYKDNDAIAGLVKHDNKPLKYQNTFNISLQATISFLNKNEFLKAITENDLNILVVWLLLDLDPSSNTEDIIKLIREIKLLLLIFKDIILQPRTVNILIKKLSIHLKEEPIRTETIPAIVYILRYGLSYKYDMNLSFIIILSNILVVKETFACHNFNFCLIFDQIQRINPDIKGTIKMCYDITQGVLTRDSFENIDELLNLANYGTEGVVLLSLLSKYAFANITMLTKIPFSIVEILTTTPIPIKYQTKEFQLILAEFIKKSYNINDRFIGHSNHKRTINDFKDLFFDLGSLSSYYYHFSDYCIANQSIFSNKSTLISIIIKNTLVKQYMGQPENCWNISEDLYDSWFCEICDFSTDYFDLVSNIRKEKEPEKQFITDIFLSKEQGYDIWLKYFVDYLLGKISLYIPHMKIFEYFSLEEVEFSEKTIPFLFYLFIYLDVKGNTKNAIYILTTIHELASSKDATNKLHIIFDLIKLIRTGKLLGEIFCSKIYNELNLKTIYEIAINSNNFSFAYMLYEEYYANTSEQLDYKVLKEIYEAIDDPDSISAIPIQTTFSGMLASIHNKGSLDSDLSLKEIILDKAKADLNTIHEQYSSDEQLSHDPSNELQEFSSIMPGLLTPAEDLGSYQWALELGNWKLPDNINLSNKTTALYHSLKDLSQYVPGRSTIDSLDNSILSVLKYKASFKSQEEWLDTIQELGFWKNIIKHEDNVDDDVNLTNINFVRKVDMIRLNKFSFRNYKTNIIARYHLTKLLNKRHALYSYASRDSPQMQLILVTFLSDFVHGAIDKNMIQDAVKTSFLIEDIIKSTNAFSTSMLNSAKYIIANAMWSLEHTKIPIELLKNVLSNKSVTRTSKDLEDYKPLFSISGEQIKATLVKWSSESSYERADDIFNNYIKDINITIRDNEIRSEIYYIFGEFFNKQVQKFIKTNEYDRLKNKCSVSYSELQALKTIYSNESLANSERKDAKKHYTKTYIQYEREKNDLLEMKESHERFVTRALSNYINVLVYTNKYNYDVLDKFCSLWFQFDNDANLNNFLYKEICTIPSYKFLPWINQIASKLSLDDSEFQKTLQILLKRVLYKLPYDSLYSIMSILMYKSQPENMDETMTFKLRAVDNILKELTTFENGEYYKTYVNPILEFCENSIKLANVKLTKNTKTINLENVNIGNYWLNILPTQSLPLPTMKYSISASINGKEPRPYITSIKNTVAISTTGISLPKIVTITVSDGSKHKVLLKGSNDDLRQDSIMEQIFKQVNKIIENDPNLKGYDLKIRTYEVLPLGPSAGIIEFVSNSVSLHQVLTSLHKNDKISFEKARKMMKTAQNKSKSEKLDVYLKLTNSIKPQLRHFFFNNFTNPQDWLQAKTKYTKGTAVMSIVGYILGLGDRHLNNILLDQSTGEPIHIDLGIAFDQGRLLPVPELVPFRLTKDIIDGFGVTGVEGTFRNNCEHIYKLLRNDFEKVLHVLNILKWDPLYSWVMSPVHKHRHLFDEDSQFADIFKFTTKTSLSQNVNDNNESFRAIQGVENKLIGSGLSIESTVQEVIREATDPNNLSDIYMGWSPFY